MLRYIAILIGLGLFLIHSGCGTRTTPMTANAQNNPYAVSGELTYLQRIALPPGSVAVVELRDVSIADAPAPVMAEERIDLMDRQVPVPFRLTVDQADLGGARRYSVRGAIYGPDERLLWTTTEAHLIDPAAPGANLGVLMLSPVGTSAGPGGSAEAITARGNEPGWRLDIGPEEIVLLMDLGQTRVAAPGTTPETAGASRIYRATADGRPLTATVLDRLCADSMTGMPHPYTVTVVIDGRELSGCGGDPADLLQGAEWVVEDLNGRGIIDNSRGTLNFGTDGSLTGRSFCNTYRAGYTLSGENLTVSLLASTLMACAPALGEQETLFTSLLGGVQRFELDETGALILHSSAGTIKARRE